MDNLAARFGSRFGAQKVPTAEQVAGATTALSVANQLKEAQEEIKTRKRNSAIMFGRAMAAVEAINGVLKEGGHTEFKNIPLPNAEVKDSDTKRDAYSLMCLEFYAYTTSVMYERLLETRVEWKRSADMLLKVAEYKSPVTRTSSLDDLDMDQLEKGLETPAAKPQAPGVTPSTVKALETPTVKAPAPAVQVASPKTDKAGPTKKK